MIRRVIKARYFALAVLAAAQLSATLHAAEHGFGEHEHEGVSCVYGTPNDDYALASLPAAESPQPFTLSTVLPMAGSSVRLNLTGTLLPPATGPPASA